MKNRINKFTFVLIFAILAGCVSLGPGDREMERELQSYGLNPKTDFESKSPAAAGVLNILPGFGNFYLATGTGESDQWIVGFLNLLSWPFSPIWAVPEAVIDASNINVKSSVDYYRYDRQGKKKLEELRKEKGYY